MGTKYEVYAYRKVVGGYADELVYQGFWMIAAVWATVKAKRTAGCVRFEWRS